MSVVSTTKDPQALTLTVVAEFAAPPERVWQVWSDPRQLERWWGPPTYPATFTEHELVVGGRSRYFMTSPEGEKAYGWWQVVSVDEPRSLEVDDGFSDQSGEPDPSMPSGRMRVDLEHAGPGTRMTVTTAFPTADAMEEVLQMGMEEGMTEAMNQIDALLEPARH